MRIAIPATLLLLLPGCVMGPDYAGPPRGVAAGDPPAAFGRGDAGMAAEAPSARWWASLHDPLLDWLIESVLAANPELAGAEARLRQARAGLRIERANGLPKIGGTAIYANARLPGVDLGGNDGDGEDSDLNLYNAGFDASWEIDLFGGRKRSIEAARATAEMVETNLDDLQVSLCADVAGAYVNLRDRQQRLALARRAVAMQQEMLALTQQRFDRGTASRSDVSTAQEAVDAARGAIPQLEIDVEAYLGILATLAGKAPTALDAMLGGGGPVPLPGGTIAVGDPASLIRRRPDIRAAERRLAAETARIGVAEAARFPKLSFMGIIGIGGTSLGDLGRLDDFASIAAPQLSWTLLDFGRSRGAIDRARAVRDEAAARYQTVVLAALRDAEGALSRFRRSRTAVAMLARAKASADETATLEEQRYKAGTATLISVLETRRRAIAAEQNLISAQAALTGNFVAIQKALGLAFQAAKPL